MLPASQFQGGYARTLHHPWATGSSITEWTRCFRHRIEAQQNLFLRVNSVTGGFTPPCISADCLLWLRQVSEVPASAIPPGRRAGDSYLPSLRHRGET